jgi:deoxyadenosine/deoxycytidine kinase
MNKITVNNTIMARNTSLEHQLQLAESLKSYLHGFQERLGEVAQNYKSKCNQLYDAGMIDEVHKDFEQNYMQATIRKTAVVVEQINEADIPFVEKFIADLEETLAKHRSN